MKIRNNCDVWTCARQNRNGMCAQLSLNRLRCSHEEDLCPCLLIKRIAKTLIRLDGWPRCGFVRFFDDIWTRTGPYSPYSPWLKDEPVQLSEMGFRRFWARRESCVVQKAPILVGSTGPVLAPYWSARLTVGYSKARMASARARTASKVAPSETRGVHVRVHAILGQKPKIARTHREPGKRMWQLHRRRVISYGLPKDHSPLWLPKSYEPGHTVGLMHAT